MGKYLWVVLYCVITAENDTLFYLVTFSVRLFHCVGALSYRENIAPLSPLRKRRVPSVFPDLHGILSTKPGHGFLFVRQYGKVKQCSAGWTFEHFFFLMAFSSSSGQGLHQGFR